jgi:hypothetical protein
MQRRIYLFQMVHAQRKNRRVVFQSHGIQHFACCFYVASCWLGSRVNLVLFNLIVDEKPITIVMDEGVSPSRRVNFF